MSVPDGAATPQRRRIRRLRRPSAGRVAVTGLILWVVLALGASVLVSLLGLPAPTHRDPRALDLFGQATGPDGAHPLGVDPEGRDVVSRILYGARSLLLVVLAASGLAAVAGGLVAVLGRAGRWAQRGTEVLVAATGTLPALLVGLAWALSLRPSFWRLILPIALTQLGAGWALWSAPPAQDVVAPAPESASPARESASPALEADPLERRRARLRAVAALVAGAMMVDFGLTFLAVGPGGATPQLGAMVARAGLAILRGDPVWWALLFPGLVVIAALLALQRLAVGARTPRTAAGRRAAPLRVMGPLRIVAMVVLGWLLCGRLHGGDAALAGAFGGGALGTSFALLLGAGLVWGIAGAVLIAWLGRQAAGPRPRRRWPSVVPLAAALPIGWVGFGVLALGSQSVGSIPVLPLTEGTLSLTAAGTAAGVLVGPWLILGLGAAAVGGAGLGRIARCAAESTQTRVAADAGVSARRRARQRRRTLSAHLLSRAGTGAGAFLSSAAVLEATFHLPGAGARAVSAFGHARPGEVRDVTFAAVLLAGLLSLLCEAAARRLDPAAALDPDPASVPATPPDAAPVPATAPEKVPAIQRGSDGAVIMWSDARNPLHPGLTLGRQIADAMAGSRRAARDRAIDLLELAGVGEPHLSVDRRPGALSSLERQRAQLALLLANRPARLALCDVTSGLSPEAAEALDADIARMTRQLGCTVAPADPDRAAYVASPSST